MCGFISTLISKSGFSAATLVPDSKDFQGCRNNNVCLSVCGGMRADVRLWKSLITTTKLAVIARGICMKVNVIVFL